MLRNVSFYGIFYSDTSVRKTSYSQREPIQFEQPQISVFSRQAYVKFITMTGEILQQEKFIQTWNRYSWLA